MQKLKLNNEIVSMRRSVRKAQVHVIHRMTREINKLKNRKGSEKQVEKCKRKAARLKDELNSIKKIKLDDVSKFAIKNTRTLEEILTNPQSPCFERALGRLACHPDVMSHVNKLRSEPVDWVSLLDDLGTRTKEKKKRGKKPKEVQENGKFQPGHFVRIRRSSSNEDLTFESLNNKNSCSECDVDTEQYNRDHNEERDSVSCVNTTENSKRRNERKSNTLQHSEETIESNSLSLNKDISDLSYKNSEHSSAGELAENFSSTGNVNPLKPDPFFLTDDGEYLSSIVKDEIPDDDKTTVQKIGNSSDRLYKASQGMKITKGRGNFMDGSQIPGQHRHKFRLTNGNERTKKINEKRAPRRENSRGKPIMEFKDKLNEPSVSLHPSWEAKKKLQQQQINIHAFQGKKITFDND